MPLDFPAIGSPAGTTDRVSSDGINADNRYVRKGQPITSTAEITARSGASTNTEIGASGPGGQSGIRFGSGVGTYDANLYRESTGKLHTNSKLQVDSDLSLGATDDTVLQHTSSKVLSVLLGSSIRYQMVEPSGTADASGLYITIDTGGGLILQQVLRGDADSGGTGYRMLRVAN